MPCRSDYMEPTHKERTAAADLNKQFKHLADRLTYSMDVMREYLLGTPLPNEPIMGHVNLRAMFTARRLREKAKNMYVQPDAGLMKHVDELVIEYNWLNAFVTRKAKMRPVDFEKIKQDQINHRKADLARLLRDLGAAGDTERLRKVIDADPTKPLEPQLGFSPDEF